MAAEASSTPAVPPALDSDPDDVVWALQTSSVEWGRGAYADAIQWIRRAAEAAIERQAWGRASELNAVAARLARSLALEERGPEPEPSPLGDDIDALLAQPLAATRRAPGPRPIAESTTIEFEEIEAEEIDAELIDSDVSYSLDDFEAIDDVEALAEGSAESSPGPSLSSEEIVIEPEELVTEIDPGDDAVELLEPELESIVENTSLRSPVVPEPPKPVLRATSDYLEEPSVVPAQPARSVTREAPSASPELDAEPPAAPTEPQAAPAKPAAAPAEPQAAPAEPTRGSELPEPPPAPAAPAEPAPEADSTAAPRSSAKPELTEEGGAERGADLAATPAKTEARPPGVSLEPETKLDPKISLDHVEGLEDLPPAAQAKLVESVRVARLDPDRNVGEFAVLLVLEGDVVVMPAEADVAATEVKRGEVVFTRGSLDEALGLRVVTGKGGALVGVWDAQALDDAMRDCPWVADELRMVADRHRALAGLCVGEIGMRLDLGLRRMVFAKFDVRRVLPGEIVCRQGEKLVGMYVVGAGGIEIVVGSGDDGRVSRVLGSGEVLFARQVLGAGTAPALARGAPSGALVLFAPRAVAHELMVSVPPLLEILAG